MATLQNERSNGRLKRKFGEDNDLLSRERAVEAKPNARRHPKSDDDNTERRLACPFFKFDRLKHLDCLQFNLKRVKDVKQHLVRKHTQPHYCPSCGEEFTTQKEQLEHSRVQECQIQDYPRPGGITLDQQKKMSARTPNGMGTSDAWFSMWDLLFPERPHPSSVYIDITMKETLSIFRDFCLNKGQEIIVGQPGNNNHGEPTSSDQLRSKYPLRPLATDVISSIERLIQAFSTAIDQALEAPNAELEQPRRGSRAKTCSSTPHEAHAEPAVGLGDAALYGLENAGWTAHGFEPWDFDFLSEGSVARSVEGSIEESIEGSTEWSDPFFLDSSLESFNGLHQD